MEHHDLASETMNVSRAIPHNAMLKILPSETTNNSRCIPHDLMLEILSRVPGRSLVRFRCVCKLWNSLFHDSQFVSRHLNHASKNPTTFVSNSATKHGDRVIFQSVKVEADKLVLGNNKFIIRPVKGDHLYCMSNSCDGLFVFHGWRCAYVTNPCTREWMALPKFSFHMLEERPILGLGLSRATGKYKVVRIFYSNRMSSWSCEVLTLGIDSSWRSLGRVPYHVTQFEPGYANGYIYWTIDACYNRILAFNLCQEKFMEIRLPQLHRLGPLAVYRHLCIGVLEGCLCLIDWRLHVDNELPWFFPVMHTHVLKNHEDSVWTESHTIRLGRIKRRPIDRSKPLDLESNMFPIAIGNGKVLLYRPYHRWRLHDLHTGTCSKIELRHLEELSFLRSRTRLVRCPFTCAESIVPVPNCRLKS